ncbi:hypothetical protein A7Q09_09550 [Methylacidiphilum sp. Yel]|jgi:hypothetical protein|nr:hypothetical protein A7Q09_09550 [Methylacidiphilum sp. Yel]
MGNKAIQSDILPTSFFVKVKRASCILKEALFALFLLGLLSDVDGNLCQKAINMKAKEFFI